VGTGLSGSRRELALDKPREEFVRQLR
jgi:hypothetical protein